jgi:hypothetical protein
MDVGNLALSQNQYNTGTIIGATTAGALYYCILQLLLAAGCMVTEDKRQQQAATSIPTTLPRNKPHDCGRGFDRAAGQVWVV